MLANLAEEQTVAMFYHIPLLLLYQQTPGGATVLPGGVGLMRSWIRQIVFNHVF